MRVKSKRLLALLLSVAMIFSMNGVPTYAADLEAETSCPHHVHDESCGYSEGTPCTHEHTDDCYTLVTECVHEHTADCYLAETEDGAESRSEDTDIPSDASDASDADEKEPIACTHVCSEESGCITKKLNCQHVHDETCGYSEGSPCTFDPADCELCNPKEDSSELTILSWEWIGADNLNEGALALPGVGEANPVDFDTVVSMLPTGVTAKVEGSEESVELALTWSCEDFPKTAADGEYTFAAALPEGYTLRADAGKLTVTVTLGGGETLATVSKPAGEGTVGFPYIIQNKAELFWFAGLVNGTLTDGTPQNANAHAQLRGNIDLGGDAWTPIGTKEHPYNGTFIGSRYFTISNMTIGNAGSYSGLFGCVTGTVLNLTVTGSITVSDSSVRYVGGVVAYADNDALLSGLTSKVNITVTGTDALRIGGIVGGTYNNVGITIQKCVFEGSITVQNGVTASQLGGIIGYAWVCTVKNCANLGTVSGGNQDIGGIIGYCNNNEITIRDCLNGVAVTGSSNVGGIIGRDPSHQAVINWCFYIDGNDGDVGNGDQKRAEKVTAEQIASGYVTYRLNEDKSENVTWYQTIGQDPYPTLDTTHGVVYKIDGQYSNASDHVHDYSADGFCTNCGYYQPAILENGVYQISNAGQLFWFAALVNRDRTHADIASQNADADAKLMNDITIPSGMTWIPIGDYGKSGGGLMTIYHGTFDGAGHTINGMVTNKSGSDYQGFVGWSDTGVIKNLTLGETCRVQGNSCVGAICGYNTSSIQNCANRGTVTGSIYVGGICGENSYDSTIANCYNTGTVSGTSYAGGVCGSNDNSSTITNCYNAGTVSGTSYAGGVCGYNANGSAIFNCYWLKDTARTGTGFGSGKATVKTADQFASGEVCYLLNRSNTQSPVWRQNVDQGTKDALPVLDSSHSVVYAIQDCAGVVYDYSNTAQTEPIHSFVSNGLCPCGQYEPAEQNDIGVYEITNAGQLFWFAALVNGDNTHAEFEAQNKAASTVLASDITIPDGYDWTSIGNGSIVYTGTFDGRGHTISGMTIEDAGSYSGLFGNSEGTIKSFTLTGSITVTTNDVRSVAGVAGYMKNTQNAGGTVSDVVCGVDITVTSTDTHHIGGIVGSLGQSSSGTAMVERCLYTGTLTASESVDCQGGIAAYAQTAAIRDCGNQGDVTGKASSLGGILGYCNSSNVSVTNCYNTGSVVKSDGTGQGAIIGMNNFEKATVSNCYYLEGSAPVGEGQRDTDAAGTVVKEDSAFSSGEVTWLLNGSTSEGDLAWYQNLDNGQTPDAYPVLDSTHGTVYRIEGEPVHYSNTDQPAQVISVDIIWGDLSFTYSDGTWNPSTHTYEDAGWTADTEHGNAIQVDNTGNVAVTVSYAYTAIETGMTGSFVDGDNNPVSALAMLPPKDSTSAYLVLKGKPEKTLNHAAIGRATVTIGGENE